MHGKHILVKSAVIKNHNLKSLIKFEINDSVDEEIN